MMIESIIAKLFENSGMGIIDQPITSVPGGFMHRMYKVHAGDNYYAVKHLNPGVMSRESFYVFSWQEGKITDWDNITSNQCYEVGTFFKKNKRLRSC